MGLSSTTSRWTYTGNDATDTFSFNAKILAASDLRVTKRLISTGEETDLVLNTDYTVTGIGLNAGGSITLDDGALPSTYRIVIRRVRPLTQETDIRNQLEFYPEIHEDKFDELTMIHQQQQDQLDRGVALPETLTASDFDPMLPLDIVDASNKVLVVNSSSNGWLLKTLSELINIAGALAASNNLSDLTSVSAALVNLDISPFNFQNEHAITASQSATILVNESFDGDDISSVIYEFEIIQSTTVQATGKIALHYLNGTWVKYEGEGLGTAHGIEFSLSQSTTVVQLKAAETLDLDGTLKLKRHVFYA